MPENAEGNNGRKIPASQALTVAATPPDDLSMSMRLVTGIFLIIAEPARSLANDAFQLKMILLVLVLLLYRHLLSCVSTQTDFPASSHHLSVANKLLAALSILMWISIIFAGRWIAYL